MKRPILFGTLATVAAIGVGVLMIPRPTLLRFNDLQVEEYEWKEIISTHKENPELNPGRILFGNIPLQLDADHNRLFFTIASDSAASLIPTVSLPREDQINMVSRESKLSIGKMSENEPIPVLIFTPQEYRVMDLVVTSLPIMNIDTLGNAEFDDNDSEAEIQLYSENTAIDSKTLIHLRGSTSYFLEKQSFKLSLMKENGKNNKLQLLDMRADDDWILNSLYGDFEKVRNILSAQLWKDCCTEHNVDHIPNSFEYRFVELFIDNSYNDLYILGYKPDKKVVDLQDNEVILKNRDWTNAEVLHTDPNFERYYSVESDTDDELAAQTELMHFLDILAQGNTDEIRANFDIINAIDVELHAMLTAETDYVKAGKTKNLYVTIKQRPERRYVLYTPWDFDLSFGNTWQDGLKNNTSTLSYGATPDTVPESAAMPAPILLANGDTTIRQELKDRYAELRNGAWSDQNIVGLINNYEAQIFASGAYYRDCERWPLGNFIEGATNLSKFRDFVEARLKFLDDYYDFLPAEWCFLARSLASENLRISE